MITDITKLIMKWTPRYNEALPRPAHRTPSNTLTFTRANNTS